MLNYAELWPKKVRVKPTPMTSQSQKTSKSMERVAGIEPARPAWEAGRLPLHHTRIS